MCRQPQNITHCEACVWMLRGKFYVISAPWKSVLFGLFTCCLKMLSHSSLRVIASQATGLLLPLLSAAPLIFCLLDFPACLLGSCPPGSAMTRRAQGCGVMFLPGCCGSPVAILLNLLTLSGRPHAAAAVWDPENVPIRPPGRRHTPVRPTHSPSAACTLYGTLRSSF